MNFERMNPMLGENFEENLPYVSNRLWIFHESNWFKSARAVASSETTRTGSYFRFWTDLLSLYFLTSSNVCLMDRFNRKQKMIIVFENKLAISTRSWMVNTILNKIIEFIWDKKVRKVNDTIKNWLIKLFQFSKP